MTGMEAELSRGSMLGKYRLSKKIGTGGFCEVWKARDTVEDRWVAVKTPIAGNNSESDRQGIMREIRMVAHLEHPHIMPVRNADIVYGQPILVTELCAGTLDDCSRPMSVKRIIGITAQVLDALGYAHSKRVVHCDVTPGNIFLFDKNRAALGDFGIGRHIKGKMPTIEEFGTPGYVAPEQAYGHPSYGSDCFSVGLVLYEYITGYLPRWPFSWPLRGHDRLRSRTSGAFVRFMRQSLRVEPDKRFANAGKMLGAMRNASPKGIQYSVSQKFIPERKGDWRQMRREAFIKKYSRVFPVLFRCVDCGEPVAEQMSACPWCGSLENKFDTRSQFNHICPDCHKGVMGSWRYCPWCYRAGFETQAEKATAKVKYDSRCEHCRGRLMNFMRYCPWCHRKVRSSWQVNPFGEVCEKCDWSVDGEFWNYCPWCSVSLFLR